MDGLSKSSNWCYDYQYLCEDFHRRPTGCGTSWVWDLYYTNCRDTYNSDMLIGDTFGCNPSGGIAALANIAFPNLSQPAHAFGFYKCQYCHKTLNDSNLALQVVSGFSNASVKTFYTVCR